MKFRKLTIESYKSFQFPTEIHLFDWRHERYGQDLHHGGDQLLFVRRQGGRDLPQHQPPGKGPGQCIGLF
jgi:hypothetical protein